MKKIVALIAIIVLLIIIKNLAASIYAKITQDNPAVTLQNELSSQQQRNKFLHEQYEYVKTNDFIEQTARRKLGMVKTGEHIVIAPLASEAAKQETSDTRPNWKKWFKLFF